MNEFNTKDEKVLLIDTYGDIFDKLLDNEAIKKRELKGEYSFQKIRDMKIYRVFTNDRLWITKLGRTEVMKNLQHSINFDCVITIGGALYERQ